MIKQILIYGCIFYSGWVYAVHTDDIVTTNEYPLEYKIKAAYIYHFTQFISWPTEKLAQNQPIHICSLGEDKISDLLHHVEERRSQGHNLKFSQYTEQQQSLSQCHVLYVAMQTPTLSAAVLQNKLQQLNQTAILTVSAQAAFIANGGMLALVIRKGKVRFQLKPQLIEAAGMKASAKLLELAEIIE